MTMYRLNKDYFAQEENALLLEHCVPSNINLISRFNCTMILEIRTLYSNNIT